MLGHDSTVLCGLKMRTSSLPVVACLFFVERAVNIEVFGLCMTVFSFVLTACCVSTVTSLQIPCLAIKASMLI